MRTIIKQRIKIIMFDDLEKKLNEYLESGWLVKHIVSEVAA